MSVADQINRIGDNLYGGFRALGQDREEKARLGLAGAKIDADLAERALGLPQKKLGAMQAKQELDALNAPLSVWDVTPNNDTNSLEHAVWSKDGEPSLMDRTQDLIGARLDTQKGSPTRGRFLKGDGTPMTRGEFQRFAPQVAGMYLLNTDPMRVLRAQDEKLEGVVLAGGAGADKAQAMRGKIQGIQSDPSKQLAMYQNYRDYVSRFNGPDAKKAVERMDKKIKRLQGLVDKASDRQAQRGLMDARQDRIDAREAAKAKRKAEEAEEPPNMNGYYQFPDGSRATTPSEFKALWGSRAASGETDGFGSPVLLPATDENLSKLGVRFIPHGTAPETAAVAAGPGQDAGGPSGRFKVGGGKVSEPAQQPAQGQGGVSWRNYVGDSTPQQRPAVPKPSGERQPGNGEADDKKRWWKPDAIAEKQRESEASNRVSNNLEHMIVDESGTIWSRRLADGQFVKVMGAVAPEVQYGNRTYQNPDYAGYAQLVESIRAHSERGR